MVASLLRIERLAVAAPDLEGIAALAFTSVNGVEAFAALTDRRDRPVFAVGDRTAEAARAAGFGQVASAGGAIGDLADLLRHRARGVVLVPGAREPAGDIVALLSGAEVEARLLPVYAAVETGAAALDAFDAVLVHSPRGGRALAAAVSTEQARNVVVVTISEAAATPLRSLLWREIRTAPHPDENAMISTLGNPPRAV
ncbi:uroporphyrinogen-III synthase [Brevundimonas kwangchunensis]|uniref:Uroporphyrinogen-III synthase n=1 Tax=Brevundimonas kwangchunensis TaxID=322163 RepID=A0ABP3S9V3_9CAUL